MFRLSLSRPMGTKRGKGEKSFVRETRQQTIDFYRALVQQLRPWRAAPPKLPEEPDDVREEPSDGQVASPEPPPFTGEEAREPTEGRPPPGDLTDRASGR
jgi:hypothetical protein